MVYDFNYNVDKKGLLSVGVLKNKLTFNAETIKRLNYPCGIIIGIDKKNKAMGIKEWDGDPDIKSFPFAIHGNENWINITCTKIVRAISEITGKTYTNNVFKYKAKWDNELNMLIVDFKEAT